METLKVRVENGKLIGEAPAGWAEGTEFELCLAEPEEDMSAEELAQLRQALDAGWRSVEAGKFRPAEDLVTELRARR